MVGFGVNVSREGEVGKIKYFCLFSLWDHLVTGVS